MDLGGVGGGLTRGTKVGDGRGSVKRKCNPTKFSIVTEE